VTPTGCVPFTVPHFVSCPSCCNPNSSMLQALYCNSADQNGSSSLSQEDEGEVSGGISDRDSDAEFEQMLAEAEEANKVSAEVDDDDAVGESNLEEESAGSGDTPPSSQMPNQMPVRRKAKTKIGNKSKKKKKTKTTSKFPSGDGEDGYEVRSDTNCGLYINYQHDALTIIYS